MERNTVERAIKTETDTRTIRKEWANSVGLCQKHKPQHSRHVNVNSRGSTSSLQLFSLSDADFRHVGLGLSSPCTIHRVLFDSKHGYFDFASFQKLCTPPHPTPPPLPDLNKEEVICRLSSVQTKSKQTSQNAGVIFFLRKGHLIVCRFLEAAIFSFSKTEALDKTRPEQNNTQAFGICVLLNVQ